MSLKSDLGLAQMRLTMLLGLSLMSGFFTEAVVRHSGQYLQCSRGDCLMLGDAEVDLIKIFDLSYILDN